MAIGGTYFTILQSEKKQLQKNTKPGATPRRIGYKLV
jgi:hypothetical protein